VDLLARAGAKARILRVLRSAAAALMFAAIAYPFAGARLPPSAAITGFLLLLAIACFTAAVWPGVSSIDLARAIEHATPASRNLVLTAVELTGDTAVTSGAVTTRVFADARRVAAQVDLAHVFPTGRTVGLLAVALTVSALSVLLNPGVIAARDTSVDPDAATLEQVVIDITPPQYSGRSVSRARDPERVEALAGSRIRGRFARDAGNHRRTERHDRGRNEGLRGGDRRRYRRVPCARSYERPRRRGIAAPHRPDGHARPGTAGAREHTRPRSADRRHSSNAGNRRVRAGRPRTRVPATAVHARIRIWRELHLQ